MARLFAVQLGKPQETARGSINLFYRQDNVKELLDVALAGRGFQQLLLIVAYLYSHRGSVLLIDEPDAHLEILRQKQVYVLLREIASTNASQVILVTHSEVILEEALDRNLTLLLEGQADDLAAKTNIGNTLKHHGAEHYVRARQRGYVLYVEGRTDLDVLRALARRLHHRAAACWDEREMVPGLVGLAILDSDGRERQDLDEGGLRIVHWNRYEGENYFVTPQVLKDHASHAYSDLPLFERFERETDEVLDALILERVFAGRARDFTTWQGLDADAARLVWESSTRDIKLSDFAEEFFRRLAARLGLAMLLRKGELHRLVDFADPASIPEEVSAKLDLLAEIFVAAKPGEEA